MQRSCQDFHLSCLRSQCFQRRHLCQVLQFWHFHRQFSCHFLLKCFCIIHHVGNLHIRRILTVFDLILNNFNIFTQSLILDIVCTQIFRHTLPALLHRMECTAVILIHIIQAAKRRQRRTIMRIIHPQLLKNADRLLRPRPRLIILPKLDTGIGKVCLCHCHLKLSVWLVAHNRQRVDQLILCRCKIVHFLIKQTQIVIEVSKIHIVLVKMRHIDWTHPIV